MYNYYVNIIYLTNSKKLHSLAISKKKKKLTLIILINHKMDEVGFAQF